MQIKKQAFTLVELIVVISILAILGTIAFLSMQGYSRSARDSARLADVQNIKKVIELFATETGKYPAPTNGVNRTYSGGLVFSEGSFGEDTFRAVEKLSQIPVDPSEEYEYGYSLLSTNKEYQIAMILETDDFAMNISETNAAGSTVNLKVGGNYNGVTAPVIVPGNTNKVIIALPTLFTTLEGDATIENISANNSFAMNGYKNLPGTFKGKFEIEGENGSLNAVNSGSILVFNDNISVLDDDAGKLAFLTNMKAAYNSTKSSIGNDNIKRIANADLDDVDTRVNLAKNVVNVALGKASAYVATVTNSSSSEEIAVSEDTPLYEITNSLRFNDDDNAYLSRTPSSNSNRQIFTMSFWTKRGNISGDYQNLLTAGLLNSMEGPFWNPSDDKLYFNMNGSDLITSHVFRDTTSWYHITYTIDTTQSTPSDRVKLFINGNQITSFSTENYPTQYYNSYFNGSEYQNRIGKHNNGNHILDGYMSDINFIDGLALSASDFGEFDSETNQWKAKKYTGDYGTNGFNLNFGDSGNLGADSSENENNWTIHNIESTDQMLDVPGNNFATLNPLVTNGKWGSMSTTSIYSEGNLKQNKATHSYYSSTQVIKDYKVYWEVYAEDMNQNQGIISAEPKGGVSYSYNDATAYGVYPWSSQKINAGVFTAGPINNVVNQVLMFAVDPINNKMWVGRNGVWEGDPSLGTGNTWNLVDNNNGWVTWGHPDATTQNNNAFYNFGQDSTFAGNQLEGEYYENAGGEFAYEPPIGFKALSTKNLPEPTIKNPSKHFDVLTYTGTESLQSISGLGFQPDLSWFKSRTANQNHNLVDSVRGDNLRLCSSENWIEASATISLDANGFTVGTQTESNTGNMVSWNWKAGGTAIENTDGDIISQVSANIDAGFSIIGYNGSTGAGTIGHGLSKAPEFVIIKNLENTSEWIVGHEYLHATPWDNSHLKLNKSDIRDGNMYSWSSGGNNPPTDKIIKLGHDNSVSKSLSKHIAYAFHSVPGYSKIGKYTGNGSSNGPFIHTGFKPRYIMIKNTSAVADWVIWDTKRNINNPLINPLLANTTDVEGDWSSYPVDFLSNGFKLRNTGQGGNSLNHNFIYIAFAEAPFKYSNAR